jgi:hypothetical protein
MTTVVPVLVVLGVPFVVAAALGGGFDRYVMAAIFAVAVFVGAHAVNDRRHSTRKRVITRRSPPPRQPPPDAS